MTVLSSIAPRRCVGRGTTIVVAVVLLAGCGSPESRRDDVARSQLEPRLAELLESAEGALARHQDPQDVIDVYTHPEVIETVVTGDVVTWTMALSAQASDPQSWSASTDVVGSCLTFRGTAGDAASLVVTTLPCPEDLMSKNRVSTNVEIDLLDR